MESLKPAFRLKDRKGSQQFRPILGLKDALNPTGNVRVEDDLTFKLSQTDHESITSSD